MLDSLTPVSEFKSRAGQILDEVEATGNPVVITQHGKAKAILVNVKEYEKKEEALAMLQILAMGAKDFKAGRHTDADEVEKKQRDKIQAARNAWRK
jgi:prevent-host-death family protein